jgi:5-methylphenazine-1-carboxylate 1-monooxygenase
LRQSGLTAAALTAYDQIRVKATGDVVLMNRSAPPDAILKTVHELTRGERFSAIDDIISKDELAAISNRYKDVAGLNKDALNHAQRA